MNFLLKHKNLIKQSAQNFSSFNPTASIGEILQKHIEKPDWKQLQQEVLEVDPKRITSNNIDYLILSSCNDYKLKNLAFKYVEYLRSSGIDLNLASTSRLLKIYGTLKQENINNLENNINVESEIIKEYEKLKNKYKIFDLSLTESAIIALSTTTKWRECLDLFKTMQVTATPTIPSYEALICLLFKYNREEEAWTLLQEMVQKEKKPPPNCYSTYLKSISTLDSAGFLEKVEKLFNFLSINDIMINKEVANNLVVLLKQHKKAATITSINFKGHCAKCKTILPQTVLDDEDFNHLKKVFFERVIVGKDVFRKTTPEELTAFNKFLKDKRHYDVIIDGLNVAYSTGNKKPVNDISALVANVVQHYAKQNKSILLLGRKHMNRWPHIDLIKRFARLFLTQNLSQDDPYLLYCALNSGRGTIIVSRDLMRGHLHLLKDPNLKQLFKRWLSLTRHTLLTVKKNGSLVIQAPPCYIESAQKHNNTWHLPCETELSDGLNNEKQFSINTKLWLCINL